MKITASQLRKIIKEEVEAMMPAAGSKDPQRFLHGFESGHPMDDEGYMIKSRMSDVKDMAKTICQLLEPGDQLPAWVQDLVASAHTDLEHVKDYLENDEKMRSYDKTAMPMGEARRRKAKALKEGHARISNTEFAAWSRGDWGFVMEGPAGMKEMTAAAAKAFISSKDGETPVSLIRSWMNIKSSCCLRVSMWAACSAESPDAPGTNHARSIDVPG